MINRFILSTLLVVSFVSKTEAANWDPQQIPPPPGASRFGESVTISRDGNTGLIAAPTENCTATVRYCGAAYVYVRDGASWRLQARLVASDAEGGREFGGDDYDDHTIALSADGNTALIGINPGTLGSPDSPFRSTPKGAVYVFVRHGESWSEQQKLVRPDPSVTGYDGFGRSVALSDDGKTAVIGDAGSAFLFSSGTVGPGSAYVLSRVGDHWEVQAHLTGSATASELFGHAVDVSGDGGTVAVGSPTEAYVFIKRNGRWSEQAILTAADKAITYYDDPSFAQALALSRSGETVLVDRYIFHRDSRRGIWQEEAKLGAYITNQSRFGFTVDMDSSGQNAIVGDWAQGTVFLFHRDPDLTRGIVKWMPQRVLAKGGGVGSSVAISGDATTILVGYGVYDLRRQP